MAFLTEILYFGICKHVLTSNSRNLLYQANLRNKQIEMLYEEDFSSRITIS